MSIRVLDLCVLLLCAAPLNAGDGKATPKPGAGEAAQVFRGTLSAKDPPDPLLKKVPHKVHEVKLEAGKAYQIDLQSKDFDAFLRVEDAKGKHLADDDDSGGGTNARLFFKPKEGGTYRLIATAYPKGQPSGAYTLTVRRVDDRVQLELKLVALNAAGRKHFQRGEHAAAERLVRETLALCQKLYPKEKYPKGHLNLANSLTNLGFLLKALGKREEARGYYEQALAIYKKALPPITPTWPPG